jgi:hypothetical protein
MLTWHGIRARLMTFEGGPGETMTSKMLRAAVAAALLCTGTASRGADFIFSFGTDPSDPVLTNAVPGTVTGRILGLPEDGTGAALQVLIDSYSPDGTLTYPVDATAWYFSPNYLNQFTVENGDIVAALFRNDNAFISSTIDQLFFNVPIYQSGGTNYASLGSNNATSIWNNQGLGGITFTRIDGAVPEPVTWALMLIGFGSVGVAFRRRRKLAVA